MVRTRSSSRGMPSLGFLPSRPSSPSPDMSRSRQAAIEDGRAQTSRGRRQGRYIDNKERLSQQDKEGNTAEGRGAGGWRGMPGRPPSGRPGGGATESNSSFAATRTTNSVKMAGKESSSSPMKSTFLSGFNLSSSNFDMLSLPDPPTPDAAPTVTAVDKARARSRKKRRQSSPIRSVPSNVNPDGGDDTNSSIHENSAEDSGGESDRVRRGITGPRKRKIRNSLCHVPSPVDPPTPFSIAVDSAKDIMPSSGKNEASSLEAKRDSTPILVEKRKSLAETVKRTSIVYDDTETTSSRKRRRSRRSMLLPSEETCDFAEDQGKSATTGKEVEFFRGLMSYKRDGEYSDAPESGPGYAPKSRKGRAVIKGQEASKSSNDGEVDKLQRMVREYLTLPESERSASSQATAIERMSGYPLVPPAEQMKREKAKDEKSAKDLDLNWTSSPGSDDSTGLGPSSVNGDLSRSGGDAHYVPTMEDRRAMLLKLGPVVETMERRKKEEADAVQAATGCTVEKTRRGKYIYADLRTGQVVRPEEYQERYLKMIQEKQERVKKTRLQSNEANRIVATRCEQEVSSTTDNKNAAANARVENEDNDNIDDTDTDMSIVEDSSSSSSSPSVHDGPPVADGGVDHMSEKTEPSLPSSGRRAGFPSPAMLLPLPSRAESSSDPELAAAESRLWTAIDSALEHYSRDVLAIRRARQIESREEVVTSVSE